ncbi:MAG: DapH/DapD/GlmU-related protein, partial [Thermoanaerobaculia bacterium]|nr:DapH/DapD/GlmU-related protein [Thermoanaerobaculia bacterium]
KGFPWYVVESLLFETGYQAVVLHRIASFWKRHRIPVLGPATARLNHFLTGVDIAPGAEIGPGLMISHGTGIVVGNATRIGANALLMHGATLGAPTTARIGEMPTVGDNAVIGAGAKLIGGITVGDDVLVAVNAVVTCDVPSGSKVLPSGEIVHRAADDPSTDPVPAMAAPEGPHDG